MQISALKLKAWIVDAKEAWDLFMQTDRAFFNASQSSLVLSIVTAFASHLPFPASLSSLRAKIRTLKDRVLPHRTSVSRTVDRTFGVRFFCSGPYSTLLTCLLGTYVRYRIQFFLAIEYQCWVGGSLVLWRTPGSRSRKLNSIDFRSSSTHKCIWIQIRFQVWFFKEKHFQFGFWKSDTVSG